MSYIRSTCKVDSGLQFKVKVGSSEVESVVTNQSRQH